MKKIIALSLTFALAGAMGGIATTNLHPSKNCEECSAYSEQSTVNRDLLIGNGFAVVHQHGKFNVVPKRPVNLNIPNDSVVTNNVNNNGVYGTNAYNNQNLNNNTSATSPYGIGNANSGVLPNPTNANYNNTTGVRNTNVDSMVRTNNIDTYKNNTNQNIDNATYDNNGNKIPGSTNGISGTYVTNNSNSATNSTSQVNRTQNALTNNTSTVNSSTNNSGINSTNNTQNNSNNKASTQNTTKTNTISNSAKANLETQNETKDSTIQTLQNKLNAQKEEFNSKIEKINSIMQNYDQNTISLENEQAQLMNGYLNVIEKLTSKLIRSRSFVAWDIDNFWNASSFDASDTKNPYYLEIKSNLGSRIVCFECLNEALDRVVEILNNYTTISTTKSQQTLG